MNHPSRLLVGLVVMLTSMGCSMSKFADGQLPALTDAERTLSAELKKDLTKLAVDIGERNSVKYAELNKSADWIEASLKAAGYPVARQEYKIAGKSYYNIEAELKGAAKADQIVIVGAHYDSVPDCAGANDNGSGIVGTLALARAFAGKHPARTIRFVAFVNEEPPYFQTENMGSLVYARRCKDRKEKIVAMLSLETMGYFSDQPDSQEYPFPLGSFYPSKGNFIAFVGNISSRPLVTRSAEIFSNKASIGCEKSAAPEKLTGVGWSDHWSFWQAGYQALMVTDTAPYRYPHYHTKEDTVDKVDFDRLARVVKGLEEVVAGLAGK